MSLKFQVQGPEQVRQRVLVDHARTLTGGVPAVRENFRVAARVIVLNGGSSSGKSGIARCLQARTIAARL